MLIFFKEFDNISLRLCALRWCLENLLCILYRLSCVLVGEYKKDELLEAARSGNEEKLMSLLTPLNVNCHASDGRKSTPLHLAAGYNRTRIVQLLLQQGADVHAKDKG